MFRGTLNPKPEARKPPIISKPHAPIFDPKPLRCVF